MWRQSPLGRFGGADAGWTMRVLLSRHPCPACGQAHDLCDDASRPYSPAGVYTYTCPATQKQVNFRPFLTGTPVAVPPAGSVPMKRVDSNP
jgi:hypothetical protein